MTDPIARRRAFAKEHSLSIGFAAIADFSSFIGQEYLAGIMQAAEDYGVSFINMASAVRHALFLDADFLPQYLTKMQFMRAPLLDGLITWASSLCGYMPNDEIQKRFGALKPLPMVDIGYLDIPDVPSIRIDNDYSVHLLMEHLVTEHGFTRIAFFGAESSRPHALRRDCYKKEMAAFRLDGADDAIFMAASLDAADVAVQVEKLLARPALPQAILTSSDIIAATVIDELEKRGISVPDDIAVTGFNNQLAGITARSPVTTIDLAYFERGYQAVELLLDRIQAPHDAVSNRTAKTQLVVRQSCGCFEPAILHALNATKSNAVPAPDADTTTLHDYLTRTARTIFPQESDAQQAELVDILKKTIQTLPPPENYWSGSARCVKSGARMITKKKLRSCAMPFCRSCSMTQKRHRA